MDIKDILKVCDHTNLSRTATFSDIKDLCDDGIKYNVASVCISPCFVRRAKDYVGDRLKICTVIGFPNGYATAKTKVYETVDAIHDGADEIDMVINTCDVKEGLFDKVLDEIREVKAVCGDKVLKVIIETCLLTEEEKIKLCEIVSESGADFIKTSTGFSTAGATFDDVKLMKKYCAPHLKIKAAGGISSLEDAEKFIELGASRLGTSRIVKIAKSM